MFQILPCIVAKVRNVAILSPCGGFFLWHFTTIYGALRYFLAHLLHFMALFWALLACYTVLWRIYFCHNLRTFSGKIILTQPLPV